MPPVPDALPAAAFRLVFDADPASVRQALATVLAGPLAAGLAADDRGTVELVLAEVLNNVAEHAYAGGSGPVEVDLALAPTGLACRIADAGHAMPQGALPEGRLTTAGPDTALVDLPEGGFGWHLIRSLTADLTYARTAGRNRLSFVIPLTGHP